MYVFKNRETEQVCEFDNVEAAEAFQRDIPDSPKWDQVGDQVLAAAAAPVGNGIPPADGPVMDSAPPADGPQVADTESNAGLQSDMDAEVVKAGDAAPAP